METKLRQKETLWTNLSTMHCGQGFVHNECAEIKACAQ